MTDKEYTRTQKGIAEAERERLLSRIQKEKKARALRSQSDRRKKEIDNAQNELRRQFYERRGREVPS